MRECGLWAARGRVVVCVRACVCVRGGVCAVCEFVVCVQAEGGGDDGSACQMAPVAPSVERWERLGLWMVASEWGRDASAVREQKRLTADDG